MKTILRIFTLLLLSISTKAQFPQPQGIGGVNTMLTSRGAFKADKLFTLPTLDTIHSYAAFVGSITYRINDAHLYVANGSYWEDLQKDILFTFPASVRGDTVVFRTTPYFVPFFGADSNMTATNRFQYREGGNFATDGLRLFNYLTMDTVATGTNTSSSFPLKFNATHDGTPQTALIYLESVSGIPSALKMGHPSGYIGLETNITQPVIITKKFQTQFPLEMYSNGAGPGTYGQSGTSGGFAFFAANKQLSGNLYTLYDSIYRVMTVTYDESVSFGLAAPHASAKLDVNSTTQGFLPPRMTTTQRTAIPSPAEGLQVYDLTLHKLYVWDGTIWQACF